MGQEDAEIFAGARIFGPPAEAYGTGLADLATATSGWNDQSDLVNTYLARMSYIYGRNINAKSGLDAFKSQLIRIEATVQVRDGLYGVFDNCDVVQFLGCLTMAAKSLCGRDVQVYIANTRGSTPKIETLATFANKEIRTRILNPKWAEGMLRHGFSGAIEIDKNVELMFIWDSVHSDTVKEWMWQQVVEKYVFDNMRNQLIHANPHAFKSIAAWALEVARRGMWVPDAATLTQLKDLYIQTNVNYGVTCCHHTCANMAFNQFVVMGSSLSLDQLHQFANTLNRATGRTVNIPAGADAPAAPGPAPGTPGMEVSADEAGEQPAAEAGDEGQRAYEVAKTDPGAPGQPSMPIVAIAGVILLLCLFGAGYFKAEILSLLGFANFSSRISSISSLFSSFSGIYFFMIF